MSRFFIGALFSLIILCSCKKESATDPRNQFVGTWRGTENFTISTLGLDSGFSTTKIITKSTTDSSQLNIVDSATMSTPQTATVKGNTYTYTSFTQTTTIQGNSVVITLGGTGTINGNNLTEAGNISVTISGIPLPGTWGSSLVK